MNSEKLVRLVIVCLTAIVLILIATVAILAKWKTEVTVTVALITLASSGVGALGSLLANSGSGHVDVKGSGATVVNNTESGDKDGA